MVMSSKKIGRNVGESIKGLESIKTPTPDMKDDTLKAATAPKKAQSFAEAFRAARAKAVKEGRDPSKETFTWGGEKKVARMAGEGAKRPAPTRSGTGSAAKTEAPKAKSDVSGATRSFVAKTPLAPKAEAAKPQQQKPKRDNTAAGRRERMGKFLSALNPYNQKDAKGPSGKPILLTGDAARKANKGTIGGKPVEKSNRRPLLLTGDEARKANKGTIGGYAKGGKVDGIAIRGKTRASLKKGK